MTTRLTGNLCKPWPLLCALFFLPLVADTQTLTTLHSFIGNDGQQPAAGLILSGNTLYGTARSGGLGYGAIYAVNTDGTGFTNLYNFTNGSDGANPWAGLVLAGNTLYGTAADGGSAGTGTIFAINTNGTGFTNLHSFSAIPNPFTSPPFLQNFDGANPTAGLILSGNTLYGTATGGGWNGFFGEGTVFTINTDGTGFMTIYSFTGGSDGGDPTSGLVLSAGTLYGTTLGGGSASNGTVFAVNTDGTGFTNMHSFTGGDGANPFAGLILAGNILYGTTDQGGTTGNGTVFAVNTDGTGFTNLYQFTGGSDGSVPTAGLILQGNTLYGAAQAGGNAGGGVVFSINTDGTGFTNRHSFTGGDGANPLAGLILSGNILYGTTCTGGSSDEGTVFALTLAPPPLGIAAGGNQAIVFWPAYATNYVLQTTTNLSGSNWGTVSNGSPIFGVTLTNSPPGAFFRLQPQ